MDDEALAGLRVALVLEREEEVVCEHLRAGDPISRREVSAIKRGSPDEGVPVRIGGKVQQGVPDGIDGCVNDRVGLCLEDARFLGR